MSNTLDSRRWSSNYLFLIASIGSTVGLSNIWKFTYMVGANGGGAFVLIYLISLICLGIPVLIAELTLGRRGQRSMVGSLRNLSKHDNIGPYWQYFGWVAMFAVFLVLSFYCVIAGMTIDYTFVSITGKLTNATAESSIGYYNEILANPGRLIIYQAIFVLATTWIVAHGVKGGLERSVRWMMPALFIILILLVIHSMIFGEFIAAFNYMFAADFSKISGTVALNAFGQAFFSLGVGVGVMLTYGAYMPKSSSIPRSAVIIGFADGLTAIVAGLAIFPIVFQYGLSPAEGPGLIFMTLPVAFGQMAGGAVIGALFFLLLVFAALSSSISLLESIISRLEELYSEARKKITFVSGGLLWLIGLGTVFSFNIWSDFKPLSVFTPFEEKTVFGLIDYLASNIIMPIGGILMALIAGWFLSSDILKSELKFSKNWTFQVWRILVRFVAPAVVLLIFISNL